MNGEGVGRLIAANYGDWDPKEKDKELPRDVSYTPKDGPLPEFYEPVESPTENALHPNRKSSPLLKYPRVKGKQPIGTVENFPYVLMTSSMAEHWLSGSVTRNVPWLNELSPEPLIEIPLKLAAKLSLKTGDMAKVSSARGDVTVKVEVTRRMQTIVWMPYNWGFQGLSTGPSTNYITIDAVDPVAGTQETKACLVNVVKVEGGNRA